MSNRRTDLPHVTTILQNAGLVDTTWFQQYDLDRGKALHTAAQFLDEGCLDFDTVDESIRGRLNQYMDFLDHLCPEILAIEEQVEHPIYRYCGTLDRRVKLNGVEGILDLKGPSQAPWQAIQLSMYQQCFNRPMKRWALHLSDEKYNLIEHKDRKDWAVAKAAIVLAAWKEEHGTAETD